MIPAVQLILSIAASLFGAKLLGILGIQQPSSADDSTTGRVYVLADHPAAQATGSAPAPGSPAPAPGAPAPKPTSPGVKDLAGKALDNGWVTWGLAAVLFASPLFIAQARAAFADAGDAGRAVYHESRAGYRRLDDADDYTALKRRRK